MYFIRIVPVLTVPTEVSKGQKCPISEWVLFSSEDQLYLVWFVLSGARIEETVGPW